MDNRKKMIVSVALFLFIVMISGVVLANGIRINPPPYHFGGDALFCEQGEGCWLLDKDGQFLWSWAQADVDAAFAATGNTGVKTQVGENGEGTYGTAQIWVVPPEDTAESDRLCFFGYDEWGKSNFMCFLYVNGAYLPVGVVPAGTPAPEVTPEATEEPVADCTAVYSWPYVAVIGSDAYGPVQMIDPVNGTVTFLNYDVFGEPLTTVSCDEVEESPF
jgi:hypothetical protein